VALCPANWELVGGVARPKKTEIDEEEYECNKKAADGCPVQCIEIEK
jgi:ferredoxin